MNCFITGKGTTRPCKWSNEYLRRKGSYVRVKELQRKKMEEERKSYRPQATDPGTVTKFVDREREVRVVHALLFFE